MKIDKYLYLLVFIGLQVACTSSVMENEQEKVTAKIVSTSHARHSSMNAKTYCNPTPLPDYPKGMYVPAKNKVDYGWIHPDERKDFREAADPAVLYHNNKWYLYASCGSAYVSEDFINWEHHPIEPYNREYDPRVIEYRGEFIFTASRSEIYKGDNPLGPFEKIGFVKDPSGKKVSWGAPHIFVEDDGSVYAYWGIAGPGIYGAKMDPNDLTQLITEPKVMYGYEPSHEWERFGDNNEDVSISYVEGPWLFKHEGKYYLIYAAPGTEWTSYAFGYYVSDNPLGPYTYGENNPFVRKEDGYVNGTGHGSLVKGPNETIWAFYTCLVRNEHNFERRIGYDKVEFTKEGVPYCQPTETPQPAPGSSDSINWKPLTTNRPFTHSSSLNRNASGLYALDNGMRTWWMPDKDDVKPSLEVYLKQPQQTKSTYILRAFRLHWKEEYLDYKAGKIPRPIGYVVEYKSNLQDKEWETLLDMTNNQTDMVMEYRETEAVEAQAVRLTITKNPYPGEVGVIDFTVFGETGDATLELSHMNDD